MIISAFVQNENEDINIFFKLLLLSIPSSVLLLCLINTNLCTMIKALYLLNDNTEISIPNTSSWLYYYRT